METQQRNRLKRHLSAGSLVVVTCHNPLDLERNHTPNYHITCQNIKKANVIRYPGGNLPAVSNKPRVYGSPPIITVTA